MESETDKERIEPAATERKQRLEGEKKGKKKKHEGENLQYRQFVIGSVFYMELLFASLGGNPGIAFLSPQSSILFIDLPSGHYRACTYGHMKWKN